MMSSESPRWDASVRRRLLDLMLLSRISDEREQRLLRQGQGWLHVAAMGHEALAAVGFLMQQNDYLAGYYRDRPIALARGVSLDELASAFYATAASSSGGRQMPSHFSNRSLGIFSPSSSIASGLLPGCGLAWGLKLDGQSGVVVATVGDASTRQGDFYEAIALARDWQLPMLFLVEDNGLGISTSTAISNPLQLSILNPSLWHVIDGCDVEAVHREVALAMASIRNGEGPRFLWLKVERLTHHTSNDQETLYRSPEELRRAKERDPLQLYRQKLIAMGELDQHVYDQLQLSISHDVRVAYERAQREDSPPSLSIDDTKRSRDSLTPPLETSDWPQELTMANAVNRILSICLAASSDVVLFGEDIEDPLGGVFRLTRGLSSRFPGRVRNTPLAESSIVGSAVGLAAYGKRPIVELQFIDFIYPGLQHVANHLNSLAWRSQDDWNVPAVFYAPCGAFLPAGGMWHSQSLASLLAQFPALQVAIPSTPGDVVGLFWSALHSGKPSFILLPKHLLWITQALPAKPQPVPFGTARIYQEGDDLTIATWGNGVELVTKALLSLQGNHSIELIDLRSVAPIDLQTVIRSVRKTRRLMVVQEEMEACSIGQSIVSRVLSVDPVVHLHCPPRLLSRLDAPIGFHPALEAAVLPSSTDVLQAIQELLGVAVAGTMPSQFKGPQGNRVEVSVPVLGEGLAEATVLSLLVCAGSVVRCDQVIADLETDKAILQVEAPIDGVLECWHVQPGQRVDLHGALASILPDVSSPGFTNLCQTSSQSPQPLNQSFVEAVCSPGGLNWASLASIRRVVPAAAQRIISWTPSGATEPKGSHMTLTARVAWALAQAMGSESLRQQLPMALRAASEQLAKASQFSDALASDRDDLVNALAVASNASPDLGIAVSAEDGVLRIAVIHDVLRLDKHAFQAAYKQAVKDAFAGERKPLSRVGWLVSSLGPQGPSAAIPVVVPPAFGTLYLHAVNHELSLWLSFDHRWITGERADHVLRYIEQALRVFSVD